MLIIPIDKSKIYIRFHKTLLFSQCRLKHQLIISKEYLVLRKLRTIQATEVDFKTAGGERE